MSRRPEGDLEEAMRQSRRHAPAIPGLGLEDEDDYDEDDDLNDLNNPEVTQLAEPPMLGAKPKPTDLFGDEADNFGRSSSPKLYASAGQFPTAVQFRVWRWENGIPVALGAIDAEADEDDLVRKFIDAMPKAGDGRFQFRLRPIDVRGQELGKEFTINISEHHATLKAIARRKQKEQEAAMNGPMGGWGRGGGDVIVQGGGDTAGASYAEEMGRMFESAVEAAESRTEMLQQTLEQERDRLRQEEARRAEERISLAERSAETVQKMTEKLMESDRSRSQEAISAQKEHSGFMLNTLTSVFAQQQESARVQQDRMREMDTLRMQQDREFFERQRMEMEAQRARERDAAEARRREEREEFERRRASEASEWERRRDEERARMEAERHRLEVEATRREQEAERKREMEKAEMQLRLEREKMELEARREAMRLEREQARAEAEERRQRDREEFERKMALEREERERRERADRERWEREKVDAERKRDEERREWERRESLRREEMQREAERRREEMAIQMKQMEMNAQRDREHSERMAEMARLEREAQREAQLAREKQEREAREAADRDRQRQHDLTLREMEMAKERDREHQERMMQLSKIQNGGALGGITDMLGMDTADVLAKIFGSKDDDDSSWADAIPKVLGSIAEIGKVAMTQQGARTQEHGRRQVTGGGERQIAIQTPDGVRMVSPTQLAQLQAQLLSTPGVPLGEAASEMSGGLPNQPSIPAPRPAPAPTAEEESEEEPIVPQDPNLAHYYEAEEVNTLSRAKEAGIPLLKQKKARRAIRKLGDKLATATEEEWFGLTAQTIASEEAVYPYIEAVGVYAVLAEAKVDPELAVRIVAALKESGMIPPTVPYTEADWSMIQAASAALEAKVEAEVEAEAAKPAADKVSPTVLGGDA